MSNKESNPLSNLTNSDLVSIILDLKQSNRIKINAMKELCSREDDDSFNVLTGLLDVNDWRVRRMAVDSIKGHPHVLRIGQKLIDMLYDHNEFVRQTACSVACELMLRKARPEVINLVQNSTNPVTRAVAVRSISYIWDDSDFDILLETLKGDDNEEVKSQAAWTLKYKVTAQNWKELFKLWSNSDNEKYRLWSCHLADKHGNRSIVNELLELISDESIAVQRESKKVLNKIEPSMNF